MENFIVLAANLEKEFGEVISSWSRPNEIESFGKKHCISLYWRRNNELATLTYFVYPTNDSLDVSFQINNSCYQIPAHLIHDQR
jgi:hypothetical protein